MWPTKVFVKHFLKKYDTEILFVSVFCKLHKYLCSFIHTLSLEMPQMYARKRATDWSQGNYQEIQIYIVQTAHFYWVNHSKNELPVLIFAVFLS